MKITEAIGMISTGALLTIGAMQLFGGQERASQAQLAEVPVAAPTAPATVTADQVSRTEADLTSTAQPSTADRINQIVALSQQPLTRDQELTPMQREAVAFFERIARQQNQSPRENVGEGLRFSNMAVDQLNVRYFYTVDAPYWQLDRAALLGAQEELVIANLCQSEAIRTLMDDYGFRYDYNYVTVDGRFAGRVSANRGSCG
jgi:hypothetical protein